MTMILEFWEADGPKGEMLDFSLQVNEWQIISAFIEHRKPKHVLIVLRSERGDWIVWVRPGYESETYLVVGPALK